MLDQAGIMMAQGEDIACERIEGVNDNMTKSHYHGYFELYYLEKGARLHMIEDRLYALEPGEFILFPPYVMHHSYGEANVPFKRILLYFEPQQVDSPPLLRQLEAGAAIYRPSRESGQVIHLLLERLLQEQTGPEAFTGEFRHSLLNLLLVEIARLGRTEAVPEQQNRIGEVINYIHANYQTDLNLDSLAHHFYVSPYYLCREFKKYTNSTIVQYINVTRIMNAQRKFMETDKNVTEISQDTGFSNLTHFNRVFKAIAGMSPSEFRRQYKRHQHASYENMISQIR